MTKGSALTALLVPLAFLAVGACDDGATTSTSASTTSASTITMAPTSAPPSAPPTGAGPDATGAPLAASPELALAGWFEAAGFAYAGDCAAAGLDTDIGKECSSLAEDRGDERIYRSGPTFSEYTTWILVSQMDGGWQVTDSAPFEPTGASPW